LKQAQTGVQPRLTPGARFEGSPASEFRLWIPPGGRKSYRLAQLDDYGGLPRQNFPWAPPCQITLQARLSHRSFPGTCGFGFWNAPLAIRLGFGADRSLPAFPQAVWFFFAGPENHLVLNKGEPAEGSLAAVYSSPEKISPAHILAGLLFPFVFWRPAAARLRSYAGRVIHHRSASLLVDPMEWNEYQLHWSVDRTCFSVNGKVAMETELQVLGPLGLVIWADNQFAAFRPNDRLRFGALPCPDPAWLEVRRLKVEAV